MSQAMKIRIAAEMDRRLRCIEDAIEALNSSVKVLRRLQKEQVAEFVDDYVAYVIKESN